MRILEVLTYYRPWTSGLTMYAEWLSKSLTLQGHDVTVLTSQYDRSLPQYDVVDGVKIVRVPVALRVSKGVIMPGFGPMAWKLAQQCDVIHIHLPQFDAPGVALRGRLLGKPVVITYHCDLRLPPGAFNRLVDRVVLLLNQLAGRFADAIVTYTRDYGENSAYLSQFLNSKLAIIPPPVEVSKASLTAVREFREKHTLDGRNVIGISARLATEKGIEVLLKALPFVLEDFPKALVLHAGMHENVIGEEAYAAKLAPLFARYKEHYRLLGNLEGDEYAAFHANLDCLVVCSLNSTESFGLVQIEAMAHGNPVVASDLPGVRQPVMMTGMGEVVAPGDHSVLAQAITRVLGDETTSVQLSEAVSKAFSPHHTASTYAELFHHLHMGKPLGATNEPIAYSQLRVMRDHLSRAEGEAWDKPTQPQ